MFIVQVLYMFYVYGVFLQNNVELTSKLKMQTLYTEDEDAYDDDEYEYDDDEYEYDDDGEYVYDENDEPVGYIRRDPCSYVSGTTVLLGHDSIQW